MPNVWLTSGIAWPVLFAGALGIALALTALVLALAGIRFVVWNEQRLQRAQGGATP